MDKISIIVPAYNVANYLPKCLDSIINQTYKNIEIIAVDDGSTDESGEIIDRYAQKDSRVVSVHKKNGGLSDARNVGIDIATGEYLMFIDGDDFIDERMAEIMYSRIIEDKSDMVMCELTCVDNDGNLNHGQALTDVSFTREEFISSWIQNKLGKGAVSMCNKLYTHQLFQNVRFPRGKLHEDAFVIHRLIGACSRISTISFSLYYYMFRQGSITKTSYSAKRLDGVEALLDRVDFALHLQNNEWAEYSIRHARFKMVDGYRYLRESKDKELADRLRELKKTYRELYLKVLKTNAIRSRKDRIHYTLFFLNSRGYVFLIDLTERRKAKKVENN